MKDYYVLVAGSRDGLVESRVHLVLDKYKEFFDKNKPDHKLNIISGMAKGVDTFAVNWALGNNVDLVKMPADWNKHGKRAGYLRNKDMGKLTNIALVFWDDVSRGTKHMMDILDELDKHYTVFNRFNEITKRSW